MLECFETLSEGDGRFVAKIVLSLYLCDSRRQIQNSLSKLSLVYSYVTSYRTGAALSPSPSLAIYLSFGLFTIDGAK